MSIQSETPCDTGGLPKTPEEHIESLIKALLYLVQTGAAHTHDPRVESLHGALLDVVASHVLQSEEPVKFGAFPLMQVSSRRH